MEHEIAQGGVGLSGPLWEREQDEVVVPLPAQDGYRTAFAAALTELTDRADLWTDELPG